MKILMIDPFYYPAVKYGGPIFCQYNLDRKLIKKKVQVDILTTVGGLDKNRGYKFGSWENVNGLRIKRFNYFGYEHYTFSPGILTCAMMTAKQYDLIHISGVWNFPTLAGSLAGLVNKTPYIITPHGGLNKETVNLKSKNKKLLYFKMVSQFCFKYAAAVHFTTVDEQEKVTRYLNIKTQSIIVPNGINLDEFRYLPEKGSFIEKYPELKGKRYILFFGRIAKVKGLDVLAKSFQRIVQSYPDIYLVIAGPDSEDYAEKFKILLLECGVLKKTIFTGLLSGRMRFAALADALIFVLPSYSENFGMAVVEAMACSIPVVISNNVGIHREVKENNAGVVVETNPESLYKGVLSLLENSNFRNVVVKNAHIMVREQYDIDKVADKMISEYNKIIDAAKIIS